MRAHHDENVIHPDGKVDPLSDIETIETELVYADLEQAERRHARVVREARGGDRAAIAEEAWLRQVIEALQARPAGAHRAGAGRRAARAEEPLAADRQAGPVRRQRRRGRRHRAGGDRRARGRRRAPPRSRSRPGSSPSCASSTTTRRRSCARRWASATPACTAWCSGAFGLLDLIAFFTAGEDKPAQSWHLRRGLSVWHAAGEIHSDIQRGFVRAEVIGWDALVDAGGYAGARDRGTLRLEGRDYVMADGDVITVKFTP